MVAPIIAAAVVLGAGWRDWRGLLVRGVVIGIPAVLLSAPWYLFLYRTYGDFSGLDRVEELQYWNSPMGSFFELLADPEFIMNRFRETWGEFGWRQIHLRPELLVGDSDSDDSGFGRARRLRVHRLARICRARAVTRSCGRSHGRGTR